MSNRVTILTTVGPQLTKVFKSDGTVEAYDDAASFKVRQIPVADIRGLSALLFKMEKKPQSCIIRGEPIPEPDRQPGGSPGTWTRTNANFTDAPRSWICIDVDGYRPGFADPVLEPVLAIRDFIADCLPKEFLDVSFHWQLSSSAGSAKNRHTLKAHLWFWLAEPRSTAEMYSWATAIGPSVDRAVFRRVQVHYTAAPIFEAGVPDPVPLRSGLFEGARDEVPLVLTADMLASVRDPGAGSGGEDMKLVNPAEKPGLIGAFHRAYTAEHVLMEFLEGEFEPVSERRWTWLNGGGTPEGVWVHSDGMHVHANHNTWPVDGIVNLWDLVRVFRFGNLDVGTSDDAFENLDIESAAVGHRPSDMAMLEWANTLPELQQLVAKERRDEVDRWLELIAQSPDQHTVEVTVAPAIREAAELTATDRERLAVAIQRRLSEILDIRLPIATARTLVARTRDNITTEDAPEWAKRWVWVRELDEFMNLKTKRTISTLSYNASYDRFMGPFGEPGSPPPRASDMALTAWRTLVVDEAVYLPSADELFWMDDAYCVNTYRADLAPEVPAKYSEADLEAIRIIEDHARLLVPVERERNLMLDFLAYCVQRPGAKIRWAVLLKGIPGDGKTAFATMLSYVMGHPNVRTLSSSTLEGSNFSGWGTGQCVVAIEEVKLHGHNRYDIFNKLKPFITNDVVEIHPKGRDPRNAPNTSNYFLLTNFADAIPLDDNDRRVMPLWSPFLTKEALFREIGDRFGMSSGDYFDRLIDVAIKRHPGALRRWLLERPLSPEFRADGRAPETTVRELMVDISRTDIEMAVREALETGGEGVYPGLVSTSHLAALVSRLAPGEELRTRRLSSLLTAEGYLPYPQIKWRGRNVRLYVREPFGIGTPATEIRDALEGLEKARIDKIVEEEFKD